MTFSYKTVLKDIRFWILFFLIVRLYGITLPPLEVGHNWRQTDGLMIARNFYELDSNIFYPRVDVGGEKTGIVGCEFPILNYLIYIISIFTGYHHWYGRLIVLVFSSIGVYFFYRVIKSLFGEPSAFNGAIILTVSLWFSYSRKNIPDAFAVSLCIISLFHALRYLNDGKNASLVGFLLFGALGCLSKILAATVLTVLIFPMLNNAVPLKKKIALSLGSIFILLGVCSWYFYWVPHINATYGFGEHFFMGKGFAFGIQDIASHFSRVLSRVFITPIKYVGLAVFIVSIILLIVNRQRLVLCVFTVPYISFLVLLVYTGASVVDDRYYLITCIPALAFIMGVGLTQLQIRKFAPLLLIAIAIDNIGDQFHDFRIRQPYSSLQDLEMTMNNISNRNDMIAITSGSPHNPTPMYFAHRRGWAVANDDLHNSEYVKTLNQEGCKFIVILKKIYGDVSLEYTKVYDSKDFKVYDMRK